MILAAYLVTGLRGGLGVRRRDAARAPRPLSPARAADPADGGLRPRADPVRGRRHARRARSPRTSRSSSRPWSACRRPRRTSPSTSTAAAPPTGVKGGIGIPGFDSFLVGWSTDTKVTGLDTVPADDRPPANTMLHWAFDTMVGIGTDADRPRRCGSAFAWWRKRDIPQTKWFLRAVAVSGVATVVALECGWIVTEVGRQPWIVYEMMRTEDAVTKARRRLGHLRAHRRRSTRSSGSRSCSPCARWRAAGATPTSEDSEVPYGPRRRPTAEARSEQRRRRRRGAVDRGDDVRRVRRRRLRRRLLEPRRRRRRARPAGARADRLGDRPGLGGQPRVADLRPRRALDRLLGRVRGDLLDAVHPAQPRGARHRAARLGLRVPQDGAAAPGPRRSPSACSASRRCSRRSSWAPSSARSPSGRVPLGNAAGDPVTQLAQPALAR